MKSEANENKFYTLKENINSHILLHIPHSSLMIPENMSDDYLLSEDELTQEVNVMADMYTDDLFESGFELFGGIRLDVSRVFLDVERFRDDSKELMAQKGMGVAYTKTSMLQELRTLKYKEQILKIYDHYHYDFEKLVDQKLNKFGKCLIIDCHSFPSQPRPYQMETDYGNIDICIGYDSFHKDDEIVNMIQESFAKDDYVVACNFPYSGSIVPSKHYGSNQNVKSVMIELNRKIYMDDIVTFEKNENYSNIKNILMQYLDNLEYMQ